ncbi:MAG: fluoride efflux transporter CrcB [Solirubrobacterales bacterium]
MSALTILGVGLLGGIGALGRLLLDGAVSARRAGTFPAGTLTVNLVGSLALGVLVGAAPGEDVLRLAATGLIGSFTTFSTWMLETQRLAEEGDGRVALANLAVSLALGALIAWVGIQLGEAL